jgi:hypothetical protein
METNQDEVIGDVTAFLDRTLARLGDRDAFVRMPPFLPSLHQGVLGSTSFLGVQ